MSRPALVRADLSGNVISVLYTKSHTYKQCVTCLSAHIFGASRVKQFLDRDDETIFASQAQMLELKLSALDRSSGLHQFCRATF